MDRHDLKNKIEYMINSKEKFNVDLTLCCYPLYSTYNGEFLGFKTFFIEEDVTSTLFLRENASILLTLEKVINKKSQIINIRESYCTCNWGEHWDDDNYECTCKLPSEEEAEEIWTDKIVEFLEKRNKELKKIYNI